MASTATTRNRFNKQGTGDNSGTWGGVLNSQVFDILDEALDGLTALTITGNVTLTSQNYVTDQARRRILKLGGAPGASYIITIPSVEKFYYVINQTDAAQTIKASGFGYSVPSGTARAIACDGTDTFGPESSVPYVIGAVIDYAGTVVPSGWLLCYGQAVSRATYAALFGAIGGTYGVGDGSSTFNLPDLRGRTTAGKDDMGGSDAGRLLGATAVSGNRITLGGQLGAATHTLTEAELAVHDHDTAAHSHTYTNVNSTSQATGGSSFSSYVNTQSSSTSSVTVDVLDAGGGDAHNNTQPTTIMSKIIYAGV
jgi:microcystin-dependent protein